MPIPEQYRGKRVVIGPWTSQKKFGKDSSFAIIDWNSSLSRIVMSYHRDEMSSGDAKKMRQMLLDAAWDKLKSMIDETLGDKKTCVPCSR